MDLTVFEAINGLAGYSWRFDRFLYEISDNVLFKGVIPVLLIWGIWFSGAGDRARRQAQIAALLIVSFVTALAARIAAVFLPFHSRPIQSDLENIFVVNDHLLQVYWDKNSFPSDHAALFFAVATGIFMINRKVGVIALLHTALVICFPRVFLGLHWPSDILVGALIGIGLCLALLRPLSALLTRMRFEHFLQTYPHLLYPLLFLMSFQMATLFHSLRTTLSFTVRIYGGV